jgi:hypothetical protein
MRRFYFGKLIFGLGIGGSCAFAQSTTELLPAISVTIDAAVVRQGSELGIRWNSVRWQTGYTVTLFIKKIATGRLLGPISDRLAPNGQLSWVPPVFQARAVSCARDATGGCASDMNPGTSYRLVAVLSPPNKDGRLAVAESEVFLMSGPD